MKLTIKKLLKVKKQIHQIENKNDLQELLKKQSKKLLEILSSNNLNTKEAWNNIELVKWSLNNRCDKEIIRLMDDILISHHNGVSIYVSSESLYYFNSTICYNSTYLISKLADSLEVNKRTLIIKIHIKNDDDEDETIPEEVVFKYNKYFMIDFMNRRLELKIVKESV